ncbi:hypothetical protein [Streptomyces noursei]|uniref:hypothetical protein n=1 Tax=Streptomyces noursei TaxID=1971 RepID=UPI0016771009|nr:hypothetical protein [Streptomyces noursei]MCZ1019430.1 hypothetical protein [Streptomyces noursei]GGX08353.1 hypothetical protein GCM10010341_32560 [Streptomyces noursei]
MIETRETYTRAAVQIEVVYDNGSISGVYLGIHTESESFEVNLDRQDLPALNRMLGNAADNTLPL